MGRVMYKYVQLVEAKGRIYYYYRRKGKRIKLPCDPSSPEFLQRYNILQAQFSTIAKNEFIHGTLGILIVSYIDSSEYKCLKPRVRSLYSPFLDLLQKSVGFLPAQQLSRNIFMTQRDKFIDTPSKANNFIRVVSRLYSFGIDRGLVQTNPVAKIKKLKIGAYRPWKIHELKQFDSIAPYDMQLAMALGLFTGQRLGDVIRMRWNQISDGGVEVVQEKTGEKVWIPLHGKLREIVAKAPKQAVTILTSSSGRCFKEDHLKHKFKATTRKAGLPEDLVYHGLRKTAAVMLAEAGCSTEQIKAITGHKTNDMVEHYTKGANQKHLAKSAMKKLEAK